MPPIASLDVRAAAQKIELADIFAGHGNEFLRTHRLPERHLKVMRAVVNCRTATLGGHRQLCRSCGFERYLYHSCRNRHCPKCQTQVKEAWRLARSAELLPVPYFHQVFTLPHELNKWVLASEENQRALLRLLFDCVAETLLEFGRGELGGQVGFTLLLHSWDQLLRPHFHIHCLIASGALSADGQRWTAGGAKFLFPVRALSKKFRGKFLEGFDRLVQAGQLAIPASLQASEFSFAALLRKLRRKSWVIYSKRPFAGPRKVLDYLSRYTHRVAISNERIVGYRDGQVTFRYRDRTDGDRLKLETISASEFIGRFLCHVLPDRFMRIRHYGFLSNGHRRKKLAQIRVLLGAAEPKEKMAQSLQQWLVETLGIDSQLCPCCGSELECTTLEPTRPKITLIRSASANPRIRGP